MKARLPQGYNKGEMGDLMKKAQQMQQKMQEYQEALPEKRFNITAGGGMVEVEMDGVKMLKAIKLKPEIVDPDDIEMLEDIIVAAVAEAARKVDEEVNKEMEGFTGGLNIPGLGF